MKKFVKKSMLLVVPILCSLIVLTACKTQAGPSNYNVSGVIDDIPTITSVVGSRDFVGSSVTRYAKAEEGNLSVTCVYGGAEDPNADIRKYCDTLTTENGFTLYPSEDPTDTTTILTAPSTIAGQHIQITIVPSASGYSIVTEIMDDGDAASVLKPENTGMDNLLNSQTSETDSNLVSGTEDTQPTNTAVPDSSGDNPVSNSETEEPVLNSIA